MATNDPDPRPIAALKELVGDDVPQLIAEARVEARERVRKILADALTDALADALTEAMLERARAGGHGAPREAPEPSRRHPTSGTGLYVYCVVRRDSEIPSGLPGIDAAHSPTLIRHGFLGAVVSHVPLEDFGEERLRERLSNMQWLEHAARTHESVLEAVGDHATLIPMRLCTVYRNERGVAEMLAREAPALEDALDHLDGKAEWAVKVFALAAPANEQTAETAGAGDAAGRDSGTEYMRRRQSERDERRNVDQHQHDACVAIHERLAAVVADAQTCAVQRPEVSGDPGQMLLNGVYLLEDEQRESFLALVAELQAEYREAGLELETTGPWPAYNFVPGTIGAAW